MTSTSRRTLALPVAWLAVWTLIAVIVVFLVIRVVSGVGDLGAGRLPPEGDFDRRYVLNPWLAYLHIVPGLIYLIGAPFQVSLRIRRRHLGFHRRLGRVVLASGLLTGIFAIAVGVVMPFGRAAEASAAVVFGVYFLISLVLAYRAIRRLDVRTHRRFMIRAFAVGIAVGLIRIVVGIGEAVGVGIADSFGAAFWIAFVILALAGEIWLRARPDPRF